MFRRSFLPIAACALAPLSYAGKLTAADAPQALAMVQALVSQA